jgi:Leucine-rich repeat (LRR) protein
VVSPIVPRPWRKFLRFSVRGLIVVVLVIGGWLGWVVRSARIQREAVAAIKRGGGLALYRGEFGRPKPTGSGPTTWLEAVREKLDRDYFSDVVFVQGFDETPASTADTLFVHISHLRQVVTLNLSGGTVTDSRFACLGSLTGLETLMLQSTAVTASGLAAVENMKNLDCLLISGSRITDDGLDHLRGLDRLRTLSLRYSSVSDAGMIHVARMTKLTLLDLTDDDVTDAGLRHLGSLSALSRLILSGTNVTDAGVNELQQALPSLKIIR